MRLFRSKHACLAFSQFRLLGQLVVATLDRGVFSFLPMCASKGEIFVTPCGDIRKNFIISATFDANLYGVFAGSIFIIPSLLFSVCIIRSTTPMALWSSTGAKNNLILFVLQKNWTFFALNVCA